MTDTAKREGQARASQFNHDNPPGSPVLAWPGARHPGPGYEEPLQTRTRFSAWILGDGHPVVTVVGYPGGISLDHIEPDPTRQPAIPDIEFEAPPCPMCGETLDVDGDGFGCADCEASWHTNGTDGRWTDPNAARCPAARRWPHRGGMLDLPDEKCVLAAGHGTDRHLDDVSRWTDRDQLAIVDSAGEKITR